MQQSVASASKKCEDRMIKKGLRHNPPSVYNVGENVLIRYPPAKKIPRKGCVLHAKVPKRNLQTCNYLVEFNYPAGTSKTLQKWIPVNDITSRTLDEEKIKRKVAWNRNKRKHRQKYFLPMENDRELFSSRLLNQGLAVRFDPPKDGNCQFSALCNQLTQIGIFRSPKTLREELVEYLQTHPDGADGFPLELFVGLPWDEYLKSMACDGTYGDHLTLQAAANVLQIQIIVFSTLGPTATQIISPANGGDLLCALHLGHFAEGDGEHYISLSDLSDGQEEHVPSQDNGRDEHVTIQDNSQEEHGKQHFFDAFTNNNFFRFNFRFSVSLSDRIPFLH